MDDPVAVYLEAGPKGARRFLVPPSPGIHAGARLGGEYRPFHAFPSFPAVQYGDSLSFMNQGPRGAPDSFTFFALYRIKPIALWAAASRAIGTRNGEQLT